MSETLIHPVILAGGVGARLWPLSRRSRPKQFLSLVGQGSLFQQALQRLHGMPNIVPPVVVSNAAHLDLVLQQSEGLGAGLASCILEPEGRSTAPALALAALWLLHSQPEEGLILVMPSDHFIQDLTAFQSAVNAAAFPAQEGYIVTFGIVPTSPESGYGYIRTAGPLPHPDAPGPAPLLMDSFTEKPDSSTAETFVSSGLYLWNSGIFVMRPSVWLAELHRWRPDILQACRNAFDRSQIDGPILRPDTDSFLACPPKSIDHAVIEPLAAAASRRTVSKYGVTSAGCAVVPLDVGWSDVGSWSAVWQIAEKDPQGNLSHGDVLLDSTRNSLVSAQHRLVAVVGMEDVIVVETQDAVLVIPRSEAQRVRHIVDRLQTDGRSQD